MKTPTVTCDVFKSAAIACLATSLVAGCGDYQWEGPDDTAREGALIIVPPLPPPQTAPIVSAGGNHTCAVFTTGPAVQSLGKVRCWGLGDFGALGLGNTNEIGNNELPNSVGSVNVGGIAVKIATGANHTCAILSGGNVRCWGQGGNGRLGYGNTRTIGDNELPSSAGDVDVGGRAVQIGAGLESTCVLLDNGAVRCWGSNNYVTGSSTPETGGIIVTHLAGVGYESGSVVGDNETPASWGDVNIGGAATQIAVGGSHACVLILGRVRCWGIGAWGNLGHGGSGFIGDRIGTMPPAILSFSAAVTQISAGARHTCAVLSTGGVRCWGDASTGQLGYGNTTNIGDTELASSVGNVNVGAPVAQVAAGGSHTCALLTSGAVRCWGLNDVGQLGYGHTRTIGDNESPASAGDVDVGGAVVSISAGDRHTCAVMSTGAIRCWGFGDFGALGYGNTSEIGNNEVPDDAGDVPYR